MYLKSWKIILIAAIIASTLLFLGCPTPTNSGGGGNSTSITITSVGWVIENIHGSFFTSDPGTTCFYNWFVSYEGDNISESDIQTASVYSVDEDWYWDIMPNSYFFDGTNKRIGGWGRWYWGTTNNHKVPIGNFKAVVVLNNGHTTTYDTVFPAPGSTSTDGFKYVYTENISSSPGAYYTPMIKRAIITAKDNATEISITFAIDDDDLVYNGYVDFYDSNGNWVGYTTEYFRDFETGDFNTGLLSTLNTDGANTVNIDNSEITYDGDYDFSDISKFIVVLTDGSQYADESATYDCLSRSEKTSF